MTYNAIFPNQLEFPNCIYITLKNWNTILEEIKVISLFFCCVCIGNTSPDLFYEICALTSGHNFSPIIVLLVRWISALVEN